LCSSAGVVASVLASSTSSVAADEIDSRLCEKCAAGRGIGWCADGAGKATSCLFFGVEHKVS